jgi:hypothetical protein
MISDDERDDLDSDQQPRRPLGMVLLGGLYLFFFMLTMSTFGHPFPLLGTIYLGRAAEAMVFIDSMICLYLFLGLMKRQVITWYLLLGYNAFELVNTLVNMLGISAMDLEKVIGEPVEQRGLLKSNLTVMVAIILLSLFIYRHRRHFTNRSPYLF